MTLDRAISKFSNNYKEIKLLNYKIIITKEKQKMNWSGDD